MNLERLGSITSELSSNLIRSIVVPPGGLMDWLNRHRADRSRERQRLLRLEGRTDYAPEAVQMDLPSGPVVLMGGLPVPDEAVVEALHLAGGRSVKVAVLPVAAVDDPAATIAAAMRIFTRFGMKRVEVLDLDSREKATSPEWCARLAEYEAVVLCGESPAQGLNVLQATLAATTLREMSDAGKMLVGVDAGAAILGSRLFPNGEAEETTVGLGVLPGLLLDTEFTQSSRFGRMAKVMALPEASALLGAGLDAGSAAIITSGEAKVLGETTVTFLDPRDGTAGLDGLPGGMRILMLTEGYRINLRFRRTIAPARDDEALAR